MRLVIILVLVCVCPGELASQTQQSDESVIDNYIARQARHERGEEYREARKVITGDLNKDAVPETVVLYTIESQGGSNNYIQYLAVFERRKGALTLLTHLDVGGKTTRSVELVSVNQQAIQLATLDYGPNDPSCCPTIKGETTYTLVGRALLEHKVRARKA